MIYIIAKIFSDLEVFLMNIYQSVVSLLKILIISKFKVVLPKKKNESCVILGNGPSLKESLNKNPNFFKTQELFCVNHFAIASEFVELQPDNYVILDPNFFRGNIDPNVPKTLKSLIENTTWPMNLFLPQLAKGADFVKGIEEGNKKINICFYNYTIGRGFENFIFFLFRNNLSMPLCQNVLGAALFLSLNMKFKTVYLVGADHSWIEGISIDDNNSLNYKIPHFYKEEKNTFSRDQKTNKHLIADFFEACVKTFNSYYLLERYSKYCNSKIYNISEKSYIDAFERKKLELWEN